MRTEGEEHIQKDATGWPVWYEVEYREPLTALVDDFLIRYGPRSTREIYHSIRSIGERSPDEMTRRAVSNMGNLWDGIDYLISRAARQADAKLVWQADRRDWTGDDYKEELIFLTDLQHKIALRKEIEEERRLRNEARRAKRRQAMIAAARATNTTEKEENRVRSRGENGSS